MANLSKLPKAIDPRKVGTHPAAAHSGGGYVWDAVLEYRVWCHPERGAPDIDNGSDYFHTFEDYPSAFDFSKKTNGAEEPLALILQREYIDEPETGHYVHSKMERITEWSVEFLSRPVRTDATIPDFMSADDKDRALAILRGQISGR